MVIILLLLLLKRFFMAPAVYIITAEKLLQSKTTGNNHKRCASDVSHETQSVETSQVTCRKRDEIRRNSQTRNDENKEVERMNKRNDFCVW
ncbi:CLUMA_CG000288, isoform A [Clunio marinus]|uniref:CLUMA_CG000288, isoform A n=1 Tax=Clunio marinus TaxID=568069 RepID=A0A1J1HEW6_9DIPT|nr:CLUMA_CG000288, isoform A [Clunio marinus]